jgi:hypothetical protein
VASSVAGVSNGGGGRGESVGGTVVASGGVWRRERGGGSKEAQRHKGLTVKGNRPREHRLQAHDKKKATLGNNKKDAGP